MSKKYFSVEFYLMIPFLLEHYTSSNAIFNLLISILLQNNKILDYSTLAEICLHEIIVNQKCLLIKKIIDEIPSEFLKDILHFLENESEKFFHSEVLQNILFLILKSKKHFSYYENIVNHLIEMIYWERSATFFYSGKTVLFPKQVLLRNMSNNGKSRHMGKLI